MNLCTNLAILNTPRVWELEGPTITGPTTSSRDMDNDILNGIKTIPEKIYIFFILSGYAGLSHHFEKLLLENRDLWYHSWRILTAGNIAIGIILIPAVVFLVLIM